MYFFFFLGQSPRIAISRRGDFSKKNSRCRVVEKFLPPARRVTHFLKCSLAIMQKRMAESQFMEVGRYKFRFTARRIRPFFYRKKSNQPKSILQIDWSDQKCASAGCHLGREICTLIAALMPTATYTTYLCICIYDPGKY